MANDEIGGRAMYTKRELEEAAGQAAGAAAGIFMEKYPDEVMPSEAISAAVDRVLAGFDVGRDPDLERIRATVFMGTVPTGERAGQYKVRLVIWSGQDFRTPSIRQGAIYEDGEEARRVADTAVDSLERLNIPVECEGNYARGTTTTPLLPRLHEGQDYPRGGQDG